MSAQRGDTIVEVMIALAVFAFLAVGITSIMNNSIAIGQRSLETTLVRQQIDAQAELLRYARDYNLPAWQWVTSSTTLTSTPALGLLDACPDTPSAPGGRAFFMNLRTSGGATTIESVQVSGTTYEKANFSSAVDFTSGKAQGLWITAVPVQGGAGRAFDMYIQTCWDTIGTNRPMALRTIVRMYAT